MKQFTEKEFKTRVEIVFLKVFAGTNPYDEPFQPIITPRLLLFPFTWYLSDPWLTPLVKTMEILGEEGFFVSALSRSLAEEQSQTYHWYIPLSEAGKYGSVVYSQENAIYSTNGTWGIICSDEDHAIIGGPKLLIANIQKSVADMDFRIQQFIEMWKHFHQMNGIDIQWLFPMLSHVYGVEAATRILFRYGLKWLVSSSLDKSNLPDDSLS
jgi:hypothetical protein